MALFSECSLECASKLLDTADIVREAIYRHLLNSTGSDAIQSLSKLCRLNIRHIDAVDFVDLRNQSLVVIRAMEIP